MILRTITPRMWLFVVLLSCVVFLVYFEMRVMKLEDSKRKLELAIARMQLKEVDQRRGFGHSSSSSSQDIVVIYNRVPKTGSTSFVGVAYDLCKQNGFHVLHINITGNMHALSLSNQLRFVQNVSHWNTMKPALYHGHLAFVDFARNAYKQMDTILNSSYDMNAFLQGELQELREVQTATDKEFNLETRVSELLEQLNALERERIFMQGEFNRLKETETASDREKTKLQNRMVKLQNQKNNIEIQLDCIESSVKELANICTETSRKNINTPSPTTTTCHGEACYMSTKIIKTAYNYIKELCKDIQNLKSSLQERDEIITNIQQKDKKQAVLLKNARKKIGILWRALKASEMRDSQCGIECPAVREDVILDHACEEDWDATHCGITFSNVPEVQVCYMNNCRTDDSFHSSSC